VIVGRRRPTGHAEGLVDPGAVEVGSTDSAAGIGLREDE
jgi:hypothetical protein